MFGKSEKVVQTSMTSKWNGNYFLFLKNNFYKVL